MRPVIKSWKNLDPDEGITIPPLREYRSCCDLKEVSIT